MTKQINMASPTYSALQTFHIEHIIKEKCNNEENSEEFRLFIS